MGVVTGFGAICIFIAGIILRGWVLSILWSWFIALQFKVQEIQVAHAIGLSLIVSYLTRTPSSSIDFKDIKTYVGIVSLPLVILGMGWIVYKFM
jgi:hypothetical protein